MLSEDFHAKLTRLTEENANLEKRISVMEAYNKMLNDTMAETLNASKTPTKMSLEKAITIWKQALEKKPVP